MTKNTKETSPGVASRAAEILRNPHASEIQKSLAGSALSQSGSSKQTGAEMETKAAKVLNSEKYAPETKELAASVLSQSNKSR
jgi:hypothetical protein